MKQVKAWQKGSKAVFVRVSEADNSTRAMIDAFLAKNPREGFVAAIDRQMDHDKPGG
jgi:hypothetical protein